MMKPMMSPNAVEVPNEMPSWSRNSCETILEWNADLVMTSAVSMLARVRHVKSHRPYQLGPDADVGSAVGDVCISGLTHRVRLGVPDGARHQLGQTVRDCATDTGIYYAHHHDGDVPTCVAIGTFSRRQT